jgi:hypothetical protein
MSDTQDEVKPVPKQVHDEVVQDLLKHKGTAKELEMKLQQIEREREQARLDGLKQKEEWQKVAQMKEKEAEELRQKLQKKDEMVSNYFKKSEVKAQAMKLGIRDQALQDLDLLPMDDVQLETTSTGKLNVLGADRYVEKLKTERPHWFTDKSAPQVDGGVPSVSQGSTLNMSDVLKLQKEGKTAEYAAAMQRLRQQKIRR